MTAGQLSDRQHQQRVNAARARWAAAGLGAAAGAAAAFHAAPKLLAGRIESAADARLVGNDARLAPAAERLARFRTRVDAAGVQLALLSRLNRIKRPFSKPLETEDPTKLSPVSQRMRLLRREALNEGNETFERTTLMHRVGELYDDPAADPAHVDRLLGRVGQIESAQAARQDLFDRLSTARPVLRGKRAGGLRTRRASTAVVVRDGSAKVKSSFFKIKFQPGKTWSVRDHRAQTRASDITPPELKQIRADLTQDAHASAKRVEAWLAAKIPSRQAARKAALALRYHTLVTSRLTGRAKLVAAGVGLLAGGAAGFLGTHTIQRRSRGLAKADAPDEDPETADELNAAASDAEGPVSQNLAGAFRMWKDDATSNLLSPRERALLTTVHTDLDRATAPLDTVMERAIAAPVQGVAINDAGQPQNILLATDARGPAPQAFIAAYRRNRILQLTKDQRTTIRDILLAQARTGASPDAMARRIRDVIGLTRDQAQYVMNYRDELERLDPAALGRELRDKRFDRTIGRAIHDAGTLTQEQIDKAVSAYHRKYLAYRAMTIARTESVGAANNGHVAAVRSFLEQHPDFTVIKTWNAKLDKVTRPDHAALHGTSVVGIDTPFRCESGDKIAWPHQPGAPARQIIQCRCFAEMRLVPRMLAAKLGPKAVRPLQETADA